MIAVSNLTPRQLVAVAHSYPFVSIDQSEAFADLGLQSPNRFAASLAAAGQAAAAAGTSRRVQEGEQLGQIEAGQQSSVAALAARAQAAPWPELTIVALPAHPPRFDVTPGEWRWQVQPPLGQWLDLQV